MSRRKLPLSRRRTSRSRLSAHTRPHGLAWPCMVMCGHASTVSDTELWQCCRPWAPTHYFSKCYFSWKPSAQKDYKSNERSHLVWLFCLWVTIHQSPRTGRGGNVAQNLSRSTFLLCFISCRSFLCSLPLHLPGPVPQPSMHRACLAQFPDVVFPLLVASRSSLPLSL